MSYFKECLRNKVLCFPFLNKVQDHTLVLKNLVLSSGTCHAIKSVLQHVPHLIYTLKLASNAMLGPQLALILEGVLAQNGTFKSLTIVDNTMDEVCVENLQKICKRRLPDQLDCLNLINCLSWQLTESLLQSLT